MHLIYHMKILNIMNNNLFHMYIPLNSLFFFLDCEIKGLGTALGCRLLKKSKICLDLEYDILI